MRARIHHLIGFLKVGRTGPVRRARAETLAAERAAPPYLLASALGRGRALRSSVLLSVAGALSVPLAADTPPAPSAAPVTAATPAPAWPVPAMLGTPTPVPGGPYKWLEGARWDAARDRLLFTDVFGETLYELTAAGTINVLRTGTRKANNLELDPQGRLVACEITGHVSRYSLTTGALTDAITDYAGHELKFPNDLAIRADGTIFFSDSKVPRIFRIDPQGRLASALPLGAGDAGANGLALSPDQKTLYAAFTKEGELRAFALDGFDGVSGPRLVAKTTKTPDGLCVDREGNLYVGTAAGVHVFTPAGQSLGVLPLPDLGPKDRVTKCVFGGADGRTLFVFVPSKFFRVPAQIPGW